MELVWLKDAKYLGDFKFSLLFGNGEIKLFDLKNLIETDRRYKEFEVFKDLENEEFVKNFSIDGWTICFPNGADIAPERLYEIAQ